MPETNIHPQHMHAQTTIGTTREIDKSLTTIPPRTGWPVTKIEPPQHRHPPTKPPIINIPPGLGGTVRQIPPPDSDAYRVLVTQLLRDWAKPVSVSGGLEIVAKQIPPPNSQAYRDLVGRLIGEWSRPAGEQKILPIGTPVKFNLHGHDLPHTPWVPVTWQLNPDGTPHQVVVNGVVKQIDQNGTLQDPKTRMVRAPMVAMPQTEGIPVPSYRKGGLIRGKRGEAKIIKAHTGEVVLPRKTVSELRKLIGVPKPDVSVRTGKARSKAGYEEFKYNIGNKNSRSEKLTSQMLTAWAADPNRRLECVYDGETWPANYWYCPRCKEYKGLQPYIPEWSDWG